MLTTCEDDYKSLHWPGWHGRYSEAIYSCGPRSSPFSHDTTIRLNVLRSCRQIYVEADEIFWTSNTFSFANGVTFERFMANRRIQQRRLIRSLRLEMSWRNTDISVWNKALSTTMVSSFSGLHTLRLQIDHDMVSWAWHKVKHFFLDRTSFCDGLRRLSTLPLKKVEVAVRPVPDEDLFMRTCLGWRQKDRKMVAIGVRKILLDSQSAEEINAEIRQRRRERQEMLSRGVEMLPSAGLPTSYLSCLGNNHNDGPS